MPAGISHSIITPAALAQRGDPEPGQRSKEPVQAAQVENPQTALAASGDQLIRAPDPESGGQGPQNQLAAPAASNTESSQGEPAGNAVALPPPPAPSGPESLMEGGVGGNVDILV
jgi:hypothetical protein